MSALYTFQCGTQVVSEDCIILGAGQRRCPHHALYRCRLVRVTLKCRSCPNIFDKDPRSKQVDCPECQDRVRKEKARERNASRKYHVKPKPKAKPGFCTFPGCPTRLSEYNHDDLCFVHLAAEIEADFEDIEAEEEVES